MQKAKKAEAQTKQLKVRLALFLSLKDNIRNHLIDSLARQGPRSQAVILRWASAA